MQHDLKKLEPVQMPSMIHVNYTDAPELKDHKVGDKVTLTITGKITNISEDSTGVEVESVDTQEEQGEPSTEEAATMPLDKLRKRLPKKSEE